MKPVEATYGSIRSPRVARDDPRVEELARAMYEERVGVGTSPESLTAWDAVRSRGGESGGTYGLYCSQASVILARLDGMSFV